MAPGFWSYKGDNGRKDSNIIIGLSRGGKVTQYEGSSIREGGSLSLHATRCVTHTGKTRVEWLEAVGRVDEADLIGIW